MGVCFTEPKDHKRAPGNEGMKTTDNHESPSSKVLNPNSFPKKEANPHSLIENNRDKTIVKTVKQINGDGIRIANNSNCIIIILDFSAQIEIQDCNSCHIFLAPCKGSILIRNSTNMNIISASAQLRMTNVTKSNFFVFTPTLIAIESSQQITLGTFFIEYMELPDMFIKAKLNIWENTWSEYHLFTKDSDVTYASEEIKQKVIDFITPGFRDIYVNINQFQFVPLTYGNSVLNKRVGNSLCLVLSDDDCNETDLLKLVVPEDLKERNTKLIKTLVVKEQSEEFKEFKTKIDQSKNNCLINYFSSLNNKTKKKKSTVSFNQKPKSDALNITATIINYKWINKDELLFLWFTNDTDNFAEMRDYVEEMVESNCAWIMKDDLNVSKEEDYQSYLRKLFKLT